MMSNTGWHAFQDGATVGHKGSESGVLLLDEEHSDGARISLERDGRQPFSITCGVYGTMVHTRFCDTEAQARSDFAAMKLEVERILQLMPQASDPDPEYSKVNEAVHQFVGRFG